MMAVTKDLGDLNAPDEVRRKEAGEQSCMNGRCVTERERDEQEVVVGRAESRSVKYHHFVANRQGKSEGSYRRVRCRKMRVWPRQGCFPTYCS